MDYQFRQLQRRAQYDYHSQERLNRLVERLNPSRIKTEDMHKTEELCPDCSYPLPHDECPYDRDRYYEPISGTRLLCHCNHPDFDFTSPYTPGGHVKNISRLAKHLRQIRSRG